MSDFLTELDAKLLDDDTNWQLDSDLDYYSDLLKCKINIKKGFQTDFASIPRWIPILSNLLLDKAHREGVLHDYLFRKDSIPIVGFMKANRVFLEAMRVRKKPVYIRYPIYAGVCIGGYFFYHKKNVEDSLI